MGNTCRKSRFKRRLFSVPHLLITYFHDESETYNKRSVKNKVTTVIGTDLSWKL